MPAGGGLVYSLWTEMSEAELFEQRRAFQAKVVPIAQDARREAAALFAELERLDSTPNS